MKILYIAYSCAPNSGSEDKIGWNIPLYSSEHNDVFVITKEEHRKTIEEYLAVNPKDKLHFYYVDIPRVLKKVFNGSLYSGRLNIWHRKTYAIAKELCSKYDIHVIHQITPIEFRSVGNYGSIPDVKFVCGPLGGGESIPSALREYAKGHLLVESIRKAMNYWSRHWYGIFGKLKKCDCLMFANYETKNFLRAVIPADSGVVCEMGIDENALADSPKAMTDESETCVFLVAGRLVYRKGHNFLLDVLKCLPEDLDYFCRIVGDGPEKGILKNKIESSEKLSRHVKLVGAVSYQDMQQEYRNADVLIMPSIRETSGNVMVEAACKGIPTVTIKQFGSTILFDEDSAWFYEGSDEETVIRELADILQCCIQNKDEVYRRGCNAQERIIEYLWPNKVKFYESIYENLQ